MLSAAFIWAKTIGYLEQQLDAVTVATWFDDAELVELNEEHLILYTPSLLRRNVIMDRCKDYVEAVLKERFGLQAELLVWNDGELERHRQSRSGKPLLHTQSQRKGQHHIHRHAQPQKPQGIPRRQPKGRGTQHIGVVLKPHEPARDAEGHTIVQGDPERDQEEYRHAQQNGSQKQPRSFFCCLHSGSPPFIVSARSQMPPDWRYPVSLPPWNIPLPHRCS